MKPSQHEVLSSAPPRRGSAAAVQVRDEAGRFAVANGRRDRSLTRSTSGCTGPTYLARKSKLELVRIATRLSLRLTSLQAEAAGERPVLPRRELPTRCVAMVQKRIDETKFRREMLAEIVVDLAAMRMEPTPTVLAELMQKRLGKPFRIEQLYRDGLIRIWRPDADFFGRKNEDRFPCALEFKRMSRRALVAKVLRLKKEVAALEDERRVAMLNESSAANWSLSEILLPAEMGAA